MKPVDLGIDDYNKVVEVFHGETDRAAAVLGGSFVESYLAKYLRSFMIDDHEVDQLFEGFGPFADFRQRVEAGYAFGYVTPEQRNDLRYIGKIRNHFAHHPLEAGFDKSPVSDWCTHLSTAGLFPHDGKNANTRQDNRHSYLVAMGLCVGAWHNSMQERANNEGA